MKSLWIRVTTTLVWMAALGAIILVVGGFAPSGTETGKIQDAAYRIDMPANWNGKLIMYCHGYALSQVGEKDLNLDDALQVLLKQGYAVAQSGFSSSGWAIKEATADIEALRKFFAEKYGAPKEIYLLGHSMGGFLTLTVLEQQPAIYRGGLALCGPLAAANWFMARRVFDDRVVFDYYFPGVLPSPAMVPSNLAFAQDLPKLIKSRLDAAEESAAALRHFMGNRTNEEVANNIAFFTIILIDLEKRAGGNPFDNRNVVYEGTPDDSTLNRSVARYTADKAAAAYLVKYYTPSGLLAKPLLAIRNVYDPLIPAWVSNAYSSMLEQSGSSDKYVEQYVEHEGHCNITSQEVLDGFGVLQEWVHEGKRPSSGLQPATAGVRSSAR